MEDGQVNVGRMESELQDWGAQIEELLASGQRSSVDEESDLNGRLRELRSKFLLLRLRIEASRVAGKGTWEKFREGIEVAWADLYDAP